MGNYYWTRGIAFHRITWKTAPSFPLAVFPCQTNIRTHQANTKQKCCDGTDHYVVLLRDTSTHLLDAQESTYWLELLELKRAERCVALSAVVASIKSERYVNLLLKSQQWTLDSKESNCCDACKMNGQRNPTPRDLQPSPRLSRFDLLVSTSQLKGVERWMVIVFCVWPDISRKLMEDIAEETIDARALFFFRV